MTRAALALAPLLAMAAAAPAAARPGDLDRGFRAPNAVLRHYAEAVSVAALPSGATAIAVGGDLLKLRRDGAVDRRFGDAGLARAWPDDEVVRDVVALPGGRLLVTTARGRPARLRVLRLRADGSRDPGFSPHVSPSTWTATAAVPDGSVAVASYEGEDLRLTRLTAGGRPETGFGRRGTVSVRGDFIADALALRGDDLLVAASTVDAEEESVLLVGRFRRDGRPAPGFGPRGLRPGGPGEASSLAVTPDGGFVIGGASTIVDEDESVVWRFTPRGVPDRAFGTRGRAVVATLLRDGANRVVSAALDGRGRIVAMLDTPGFRTPIAPVRLTARGRRDPTFRPQMPLDPSGRPLARSRWEVMVRAAVLGPAGRLTVVGAALSTEPIETRGYVTRYLLG